MPSKRNIFLWTCLSLAILCACASPSPTSTLLYTLDPAPATHPPSTASARPAGTPRPNATATSVPPTLTPTASATPTRTPTTTAPPTPTPLALGSHAPVTATLHTPDGLNLAATLYVPAGPAPFPAVLLSHMGGANQDAWRQVPAVLQAAGYAVLTLDFRGHGQSEGHLDPPSAATDLSAGLAYVRSRPEVDVERIALVGASMGGHASVIVAAKDTGVRAVVAISTSPDAAGQYPERVVHQLSPRPFLAVGCDADPITRPERVRQLYEAAGSPRQIVILACAAHANDILDTDAGPRLLDLLSSWLDEHLQAQPPESAAATPAGPPPPARPAPPRLYETTVTIPTYAYERGFQATEPGDPIYPYARLDFDQVGPPEPHIYQALVLENDFVALTILPELGGRVYGWRDKATGRQLLYQNPVIKPTGWGYRGWWLAAGGIEWAFPVEEHGLNEWRPWRYTTGYTAHGLSVTVSDVEDRTGLEVGATISLDAEHAYVTLQPWARSDTAVAQPYELWLNAMLTLGGNAVSGQTQFILPATQVTVHSTGDGGLPGPWSPMTWPTHAGRDMSWYGNWDGYLGFFVPTPSAGFVGLYDHKADQGLVRAFTPGWPAGTKFFGPASLSPTLWTDDGSNYVELWSGATASFGSQATLNPGQSVSWTEHWYPVNGLGGFNHANASAALRLSDTGGGAEIGVAVSAFVTGNVTLWVGGQPAQGWPVNLSPGQAFRATWTRPPDAAGALGLRLEDSSGAVVAQTGQVP